jgi:hypothetical protein
LPEWVLKKRVGWKQSTRFLFRLCADLSEKGPCLKNSVVFALVFEFICGRELRAHSDSFDFHFVGCRLFCGVGVVAAL